MIALVSSVFAAGLLGSVHCAGMCGSFACLASGGDATRGPRALRSTAAYNGGRLLAYVALGLLAGAAGAGLDRAGSIAGLARPAAIVAGALLMSWGAASLLAALGVRVPALDVPPALASRLARVLRAVQDRPPAVRAFGIGALSAALPCGWLYAFVATAAAAGSALGGAFVMTAFWAGTVPMMAAVGAGAQRLLGPFRARLPLATATVLLVLGALTVTGRFGTGAQAAHRPTTVEASDGHRGHR